MKIKKKKRKKKKLKLKKKKKKKIKMNKNTLYQKDIVTQLISQKLGLIFYKKE